MGIYSWPCGTIGSANISIANAKKDGWTNLHIARCIHGEYKGMYVVIGSRPKPRNRRQTNMQYETSEFLYELVNEENEGINTLVKITDLETDEEKLELIDAETAAFYRGAWWTEIGFADMCDSILDA